MAKYDITCACGCDITLTLFGKTSERDRKVKWRAGQDCPKCWGAKQREKEDASPIVATLRTNGLDKNEKGQILAELILTGGTKAKKEEIKSMNFHFQEIRGGVMDFLTTERAQMAWVKKLPILDINPKAIIEEMKGLGAKTEIKISRLDLAMARETVKKDEEKKELIEKIEKPQMPECHPENKKGYWNGKYYGNAKYGRNYYVEGEKFEMTEEDYALCMEFRDAVQNYKIEIEKVG